MNRSLHLLISIFLIILLPTTWDSIDPTARILALSLLFLSGAAWLFLVIRVRHLLAVPNLVIPFLFYALFGLGLLVKAPVPVYSIYWALTPLVLILFFVFVIDSHNYGWEFRTWENALILVAVIMAAIDLFLVLAWYVTWWNISGTFLSPPPYSVRSPGGLLGHPNYMAGYMNLVIPFVVVRVARAFTVKKRILWTTILVMFVSVVFFTSSRGGWLGLLCGLVGMGLIYFTPRILTSIKANTSLFQHLRFTMLRALSVVGSVFLISIVVVLAIPQVQHAAHGSVQGRFSIWEHSIEMIMDSPWLGNGPGSYPFLFASSIDGFGRTYLVHAHNIFLQIASDTGLIGLLLVIWMMFLIGRRISNRRKLKTSHPHKSDFLVAYCGMGIALIVHNQVDFLFYKFLICLNVLVITALLFWGKIEKRKIILKTRFLAPIIAISLAVIVIGGSISYLVGRVTPALIEYAEDSKWSEAFQDVCQDFSVNPAFPYNAFQCGLINAIVSFTNNDESNLIASIEYTRSGLERDPYWFLHWANLASYEWRLGKMNLAMEHLLKATDLDPYRDFIWLNLGILAEQLGDNEEAVIAYRRALCLNPWYRESLIINKSPLFENVMSSECKDEYMPDMTERAHRLLLWQSREAYLVNDFATYENLILQSLREQSRNPLAYAFLAQLAFENNDIDMSKSNIDTALFISNNHPGVLLTAGSVYREIGDKALGYDYLTSSYNEYRYRRYSNRYYADAYRQFSMPIEMSPYLYNGDITIENAMLFTDLVAHLDETDNFKLGGEIKQWLDWNTKALNYDS